jgi:hypothetical protein
MKIFIFCKMGKKQGNKKRVVCTRGASSTHAFSWGLGTSTQGVRFQYSWGGAPQGCETNSPKLWKLAQEKHWFWLLLWMVLVLIRIWF